MTDATRNPVDLINDFPGLADPTTPEQQAALLELADRLIGVCPTADDLLRLETSWCGMGEEIPLGAHLSVKLARSRSLLQAIRKPLHLSLIFAIYKEHTRILRRSEHPHGEDFLRQKVSQLEWLFAGLDNADWDLSVVDDGCPDGSGRLAAEIIAAEGFGGRVHALSLAEAIEEGHPATVPMTTPDDSRKGGSILYGLWEAVSNQHENHVIAYTDADLSTHLGQLGLLIDPIVRGDMAAAIGSRREPHSIVLKAGTRNTRGKLFIYLWKRLFPELNQLVDTQCGFKAFTADTIRTVGADILEHQFAFDIELLLKTELETPGRIAKVPIAWFDSEAASTTTDLQPYLPMLRKMALMYRTYLPSRPESEPFADLIDSLEEENWAALIENIPKQIADRDPQEFGTWDGVSAAGLRVRSGLKDTPA